MIQDSPVANLQRVLLAVSVHTDALQVYVERLEAVKAKMESDAACIGSLEAQLSEAFESAERVAVMSKALASVRQRARISEPAAATGLTTPSVSKGSSLADILQFSKVAEAFDGESTATNSMQAAVQSTAATLARLEDSLLRAKQSSVRHKLAQLESLKAACKDVDVRQCLLNSFSKFRFSSAAEAYFFGGRGCDPQLASSTSVPSTKARERRRRLNVLAVLRGAARRLSLRYGDALDVLNTSLHLHHSISSAEDEDRLMYATDFSNKLTSPDNQTVAWATRLHQLQTNVLLEEYSRLCDQWRATMPVASRSTSLLNEEVHLALPQHWDTAEMLRCKTTPASTTLPSDEASSVLSAKPPLLPPAKHILTARFSASGVEELAELEALRMRVQGGILSSTVANSSRSPFVDSAGSAARWTSLQEQRLNQPAVMPAWPVLAKIKRE